MRLLWLAHTRDLMDFLQGLVKTGKCEIVKQERSKFVSFLFLRERWRGLFVKHSRRLNVGRQVPRCLHSHKGRVLPHPSFGRKVELQKSMPLEQFSEDKDICLSGSPTTWTAQQPQSCRSRSKPLSSTAPTPRPSTTPGATSD